ncbi:MAG: FAD-binding oxidoreductase [Methyloligellaceae bacterium]
MTQTVAETSTDVLDRLKAAVGPSGYLDDPDDMAPYCSGWRDSWDGRAALVLRPASTEEVAEIVTVCAEHCVAIVPQGGNTGLTGASQPHGHGREVVVSMGRMKRIREVDPLNDTLTVEAGVVLAEAQRAAAEINRLFPLSLAAEGSCQIGGNLGTNAGGTQVLRYGNTRSLVLGLEVVLPDGRVWNGLRGLRKDSTGYDMKQLFIGSEGTLGIITAAVLRLFPKPTDTQTAMAAVPDPEAGVRLLAQLRETLGEAVTAFELMGRICLDHAVAYLEGHEDPLDAPYEWYVLTDVTGQGAPGTLHDPLAEALAAAHEDGLVLDAVVASSGEQARRLWAIREEQADAQKPAGASIKHDVSVPISRIAEFLAQADAALEEAYPGIRHVSFGHVGDGNIHYNPLQPPEWDAAAFAAEREKINRIVHDIVVGMNGSISAEHGIGRLRLEESEIYKPAEELDMMRTIKRAFDPHNIMNPGKMIRV